MWIIVILLGLLVLLNVAAVYWGTDSTDAAHESWECTGYTLRSG